MRPIDLFVERDLCDRNVDFSSSRTFSRELNGLTVREWMEQSRQLSTQDKMSIASASIALGSPFFLLSLGAAFAFIDACDNNRIEKELDELTRGHRQPLKVSKDLETARQLDGNFTRAAVVPLSLMSMEMAIKRSTKPKKEIAERNNDQAVFSKNTHRGDNCKFLVEDRSWMKASKVLKTKFFLQTELEKANGKAEFSMIAGIAAQIDKLDKELKRLGC
jgi:hypothetical protein